MTTDSWSGEAGEERPTFRLRRLPDTKSWLRTRRHYEVAFVPAGAAEPVWTRETEHPGSLLRREGAHPTDIHDYIANADEAWDGGVGPWRSLCPQGTD